MKRTYVLLALLGLTALIGTSCRDFFTTSLAEPLARDDLGIDSSTPLSDLLAEASNPETGLSNPEAAAEILDALAGKPADALTGLSIDDKNAVLDLAATAAINLPDLEEPLNALLTEGVDQEQALQDLMAAFDSGADLAAVELLLADPEVLAEGDVTSIVLATVVLIADIATNVDIATLMDQVAADPLSGYGTITDPVVQAQIDTIRDVLAAMDTRSAEDLEGASIPGVNLLDLLRGTP